MNKIESLIFNELVSHRPVALPRVGTLRVVRRHAHVEDGEMKAPENKVVYSLETDGDIPTVTWLGIDDHEYLHWLEGAHQNDQLMIEGVGSLVLGEFIPSPELEHALNPANTPESCESLPVPTPHRTHSHRNTAHTPATSHVATHKHAEHHTETRHRTNTVHNTVPPTSPLIPPKRNCLTNILLIIAILLMLSLWGLFLWRYFHTRDNNMELTTHVKVEEPVVQVQDVEPVVSIPAEPEYHLIAGSFDDMRNAENMAERYRKRYPNLEITILDNGSGRKLVSVFKASTQREAYNKFYRIAEQTGNWEMWVYDRMPD